MKPGTPPLKSARLLDQVKERVRYLHYSLKTEKPPFREGSIARFNDGQIVKLDRHRQWPRWRNRSSFGLGRDRLLSPHSSLNAPPYLIQFGKYPSTSCTLLSWAGTTTKPG